MPTRNPRVNVVVTPDQHQLLTALAKEQNRSAASLVREMVDAAEPLMRRTVELLDLANTARGMSQTAAREALEAVLQDLQALAGTSDQLDLLKLLPDASDGSETDFAARSGATEDKTVNPPSSNTGVSSAGPKRSGSARNG